VISTQLRVIGTSSPATIGVTQPFDLLIFYERTGGVTENITDAIIDLTFTSYQSLNFTITPLTEGYLVSLDTSWIGSYEFNIFANKTGFQSDFETFTLFVQARGMQVVMAPPVWTRSTSLEINLQLIDAFSSQPLTGANVSYWLIRSGGILMEGELTEIPGVPGNYSISFTPDWLDGTGYSIRIFAETTNYQLDDVYEFQVLQYTPPEIVLQILVETYGPPIGLLSLVAVVSATGRSVYRRRKKAEFATDLANQHRFDDIDNIIGVIVLHKMSGVPIYSKIIKGGFEEGIVAAFITAVSHFREEFEFTEDDTMKIIPISDIIRAVYTKNLICAFVTIRSASTTHNRKIESFARQAGMYLDDIYSEMTPSVVLDPKISDMLDFMFDTAMDGNLVKFHKLGTSEKLPRRYQVIGKVLEDLESAHCSRPIYIAKAVAKYGVTESRGCSLVYEAIEKGMIVQCDEHETPTSEMDLTKFFDKNGVHDSP
jgi:hypothetical protein